MIKEYSIIKYDGSKGRKEVDKVVAETPISIFLNDREYITLLCTPTNKEELIVGFLNSEGIISSFKDIRDMIIDNNGTAKVYIDSQIDFESRYNNRIITSGSSKGTLYAKSMEEAKKRRFPLGDTKLKPKEIMDTMKTFFKSSKIFEETGGVHSVLLKGKDYEVFREDIGRHNAIDKAVGNMIINNKTLEDFVIYVSGRLSSEMIGKISKAGISTVISRACPTAMGIEIGRMTNMTLIGFSRGDRFNVYSGEERIDFSSVD